MISKEDRRAAKQAWRERKEDWAICAIRIGEAVWVSLTPDAKALENRISFMLRQGSEPVQGMKSAHAEAGALSFEVLERLDPELSPMARERVGDERCAHWANTLSAQRF